MVAIQLFLILRHFPVVSPVVPLRCVSPGRRLQLLTARTVLSSEAVGASSSKRLPGQTQRVPLHFPDQIVQSPQILSHLLLMLAIFPFPCTIGFPRPNPHKSYLICFYTGKGILAPLYYLRRELPKACGKLRRCKARPVTLLDFRGQIPTSPFSFAFKI